MNKELRIYKKQLKELLGGKDIKIKSIVSLSDGLGYRVFIKHRNIDLIKLKFLKRDIGNIFGYTNIHFKDLEDNNLAIRGIVRKMRIYNVKSIFPADTKGLQVFVSICNSLYFFF
jgi:hypothetical protein